MARTSVVVTVYNGEQYVGDALKSLQDQTYRDFEIIVVDDGSTDRTAEVVRSHAGEKVCLLSPGRLGRARALNAGIASAQGEYVAILDADDLALPTRLERQIALLESRPEVGLVGTGHRRLYPDGSSEDCPCDEEDAKLRRTLLYGLPFHHSTALYRREWLERVGGYDESLPSCLEQDLYLRLARHCRLGGVRDLLCVRRLTGENYFMTAFSRWDRLRVSSRIRFRRLRGICPAPAWWFYWIAPLLLPHPVRRWLRRRFWGA